MKRFLKTLKFLGLALVALIAIGLITNAVLNWRANARLEAKIAGLRDAGQPVAMADLARKPIPPETNAATYLRRAQADVEAIQKEVSAVNDAAPQVDQDRFDEGHLSPELKKAIQAAFAAYPKVIGLIEQAAACPDYDPQPDLTADTGAFQKSFLANIPFARAAIRVFNYWALVQISDGKQEEALATCLRMFRLCRHFDHEPTLVGNLIAIACRSITVRTANAVLRMGPLPEASRDALDAELARHDTVETIQNVLITERPFGLQRYRELAREFNSGPIGLPWLKNDACGYLDVFEEVIALAGRPYAVADKMLAASSTVANAGPLTQSIIPAVQAVIAANCRNRAQIRALGVLNALGRQPGIGSAKEFNLAELGLPTEMTTDPFDGNPLHVKKLPDGWLIYSIGHNLKDDGGTLVDSLDVGVGPPSVSEKPAPKDEPNADASEPGSH